MMKCAVIEHERCVNIVVADPNYASALGYVSLPTGFGIGDRYKHGAWEKAAPDLTVTKSDRIAETKTALAGYLEAHPLTWSDGKQYSVTADKQTLLNNAIAVHQLSLQAGLAPELTWNATTEECAVWTFENLCALALGIAAYVKPLVAHQQALEVAIRAATTAEEVQAVVIDYAAVAG